VADGDPVAGEVWALAQIPNQRSGIAAKRLSLRTRRTAALNLLRLIATLRTIHIRSRTRCHVHVM
jgi:hypothetical protein